jgi:hypothetical protein
VSPAGIWVATLQGAKLLPNGPALSFATKLPDALVYDGALFAMFGGSGAADGSLMRVPESGAPSVLADELVLPTSLASAGDNLYITTNNDDAAIRRISHAGGAAAALASGQRPASVVVDEQYAYWTDPPRGEIVRVPR